jgi:spoIIIJ-associated protein
MNDGAIEARGSDIEEAIQKGLKRLGLSRTDVIIDVVDEGRKGLLGLGGRDAVVRLTPLPQVLEEDEDEEEEAEWAPEAEAVVEAPAEEVAEAPAVEPVAEQAGEDVEEEEEEEEPATMPLAEAAPALPEAEPVAPAEPEQAWAEEEEDEEPEPDTDEEEEEIDEEVVEVVQEIVATLMAKMSFSDVDVSVSYTEPDDKTGRVMTVVEIADGSELNSLIGPHGETLNDLQYLVRLMTGHVVKRRANFLLDVNGYRRQRREALTKLAERMAEKAVRRGEPVTLEAMNAYDRRLIHIALRDSEEVYTNSVGEGSNRRVRIYLQEE